MLRMTLLVPLLLGAAVPATARSLFNGNWKIDMDSVKLDPKPDVFTLRGGTYSCSSCVPAYSVPADGKFHPIPGHPYADAVAVTVDGPTAMTERDSKGGRTIAESVSTLSADGKTLTIRTTDRSAANGKVVDSTAVETRVAAGPPGSHAVSGSWRPARVADVSDAGLGFTLRLDGRSIHYAASTGEHADGPFGRYLPLVGDVGGTSIRYDLVNPRTLRGTSRRGGKVVSIATITVSPDGRMLTNSSRDLLHGTSFTGRAVRQ